jgi:hypothetical protein
MCQAEYRSLPPGVKEWKQRQRKMRTTTTQEMYRKAVSVLVCLFGCILWLSGFDDGIRSLSIQTIWPQADWEWRREEVKQAFISSWDAYEKYAFGTTEKSCHYIRLTSSIRL